LRPKEIVRAGYNKIASSYGATRRGDSEDIQLLHLLAERLPKGAMVFDAGCGSGYPVTKFLAELFQVTGVDFSERQIRLAKERVPKAGLGCADITNLPFREGAFDAVCS
jgi:ubiquinone/menaquinone biosynthesis C-methylase UbiE